MLVLSEIVSGWDSMPYNIGGENKVRSKKNKKKNYVY